MSLKPHIREVKVTIEFTYTTRWTEKFDLIEARDSIEEALAPALLKTTLNVSSYRIKLESGI